MARRGKGVLYLGRYITEDLPAWQPRRRRPPRDKGGSEPVTVEPNRPKQGDGGAAAALEFDEP